MDYVTYECEYTDTFGGEANYCWVKRQFVRIPAGMDRKSNAQATKIIKAAFGLTGVRGRVDWHGDQFEFRPAKHCTVLFASYHDCPGGDCKCSGNQAAKRGHTIGLPLNNMPE